MRHVWVVALLAGCSNLLGIGHFGLADAGAGADAPPDLATDTLPPNCFGTLSTLCLAATPIGDVTLSGSLDTLTDTRCEHVAQPGGPKVCVISGATIAVAALRISGTEPLALIAEQTISVTGSLDA